MTSAPDVTVVISTMDRPAAVGRCLDAIGRGSMLPREIVIVDQSRDDATERVMRLRSDADVPVRYQRSESRGLGASQNVAVRLAGTAVVAVTDDDCIVDARWIEVIARTFAANPELDLLAGRVLPLPAADDRIWPVSLRESTVRREFFAYAPPWHVGSGNNFAVRRAAYMRAGGCDERLGPGSPAHGGVDTDLFFRMLRSGCRARFEPDAVVYHERQTRAGRLQRRPMYGRGIGASCALRLRDGDMFALRMLGDWARLRTGRLVRAALRGDTRTIVEELVMLRSSVGGLWHGAHLRADRDAERDAERNAEREAVG
jgi:GT2 family glycosyltransferase